MVRKTYPPNGITNYLTQGFLVPYSIFRKLLFKPTLMGPYLSTHNFLLIYAINPRFTRITCYPTSLSVIWKYKILFQKVQPEIVEKIGHLFNQHHVIHTTGLCEEINRTLVGNYIEPWGDWKAAQQFRDELKQLPGILDCIVEEIPIEKRCTLIRLSLERPSHSR